MVMDPDIMAAVEVYYDLADKSDDDTARVELRAAAAVMAMMGGAIIDQQMNDDIATWMEATFNTHASRKI
jgi:hypothetical protein